MKTRLTDRGIRALKPAKPGQRLIVKDTVVLGLAVRVTETGTKSFVLHARYGGSTKSTRRLLGRCGELSLEAARDKARMWKAMIADGDDPGEAEKRRRQTERDQREAAEASTFGAVAEAYIVDIEQQQQRKAPQVARRIRNEFVTRWERRPIASITSADVLVVIDATKARGKRTQAHHLLADVRTLFNWALARDCYGLTGSPCDRLKPKKLIGKRSMRARVLTDDEIRAFWKACEALGFPYGHLFKLLLLTAQRRNEVSEGVRSEFDMDGALWTLPPARMKSDAAHVVPLSKTAVGILRSLPDLRGPYLFSLSFGRKPVNGFSKAKTALDELMLADLRRADPDAVLEDWVLHDLRRTGRTRLSALRVADVVAELCIGHRQKGLHAVYDQHAYLDERRDAFESWAGRVRDIVEPPPANVTQLRSTVA